MYIIIHYFVITMQFETDGNSGLDLNNAFKIDSFPTLSIALEWQKDLNMVYAISSSSVSLFYFLSIPVQAFNVNFSHNELKWV